MEVHRPAGEAGFFEQQTGESRRQLEEAKINLLNFTATHGVVEAAEQRDLALQKLSEVDANFRQTRIDVAEMQQKVMDLEGQLTKLPERTTTQVRIADNPELLKSLKASLLDLQLKRTQLLTKFEPSHRLVQEVDQQIAQTESTITAENALPLRDETSDKNAHYEWAKSELQVAQVQLNVVLARQSATAKQEADYRAMARDLGAAAITQDDLLNTEKAAQENYLVYVKKQEEARMDDALDERGIVNVAIAEHPVVPALPLWSAWAVLAIGFVVAGAAGTGRGICGGLCGSRFPNARRRAGVFECSGSGIVTANYSRKIVGARGGFMSAEVSFARTAAREEEVRGKGLPQTGWNQDNFAREQVRGRVRQVFLSRPGKSRLGKLWLARWIRSRM